MQEYLLVDPVHEVDDPGWPTQSLTERPTRAGPVANPGRAPSPGSPHRSRLRVGGFDPTKTLRAGRLRSASVRRGSPDRPAGRASDVAGCGIASARGDESGIWDSHSPAKCLCAGSIRRASTRAHLVAAISAISPSRGRLYRDRGHGYRRGVLLRPKRRSTRADVRRRSAGLLRDDTTSRTSTPGPSRRSEAPP